MENEMRAKLVKLIENDNDDIGMAALDALALCSDVPTSDLVEMLKSPRWYVREYAIKACAGRSDVPTSDLVRMLDDPDSDVRYAAVEACKLVLLRYCDEKR